jgi:hypothetical protein
MTTVRQIQKCRVKTMRRLDENKGKGSETASGHPPKSREDLSYTRRLFGMATVRQDQKCCARKRLRAPTFANGAKMATPAIADDAKMGHASAVRIRDG